MNKMFADRELCSDWHEPVIARKTGEDRCSCRGFSNGLVWFRILLSAQNPIIVPEHEDSY